MLLYKTVDKFNFVGIDIVDHNRIHMDEYYLLAGNIQHTTFSDKEVTTVEEVVNQNGMVFATDNQGEQPFAIFTNDSHRDNFSDPTVLSKVVLKEGFHVVMSFYNKNAPSPTYIFEVIKTKTMARNLEAVGVKCVYKGDTLRPIRGFEKATDHIVKVMRQIGLPAQLQDKYCFQTTRKVLLCFMSKDERGEISSTRDKKLVLNNNSKSRFNQDGKEVDEGFFRVFYSRRFKDSSEVFVEGVRIDDKFLDVDVDEFIKSADSDIRDSIRQVTTKKGLQFYAIVNSKGELRPIIKLGHFTSFALSEREITDNIESVVPYRSKDKNAV